MVNPAKRGMHMIRMLYLLVKPEGMTDETFRAECLRDYEMSHDVPGLHRYEGRLVAGQPTDTHVPVSTSGMWTPSANAGSRTKLTTTATWLPTSARRGSNTARPLTAGSSHFAPHLSPARGALTKHRLNRFSAYSEAGSEAVRSRSHLLGTDKETSCFTAFRWT